MRALATALTSLVLGMSGLGAGVVASASAAQPAVSTVSAAESVDPTPRAAGWPRLSIPRLRVNTAIIPVGITRAGQLAVGPSVTAVYTWKHGVRPGQRGSAVIAGHTWSRGHGVFDELGSMRVGHRFTVGRHTFRVSQVQRVHRMSGADVRGLFSDRGKPRVVLITCGDRTATGVYRTRILVHARKV
ncbi:hypothetical protein DDE18_01530 [Nocardioides gansuensis]|uniref:Class F sortase n=1 Tax=Nocardioides gansuensis TaxID=2138300 RepID=A0A2T8FF31_9ACTN|nr:class F sortase [Nocardioides gansuensis]PVG84332.1 hypothetical protein DDE18_01530 [Nocardioides gansuensis]